MKELTTKFMPKVNIEAINTYKNTEDKKMVYTSFDGDYMHFMQDMLGVCLFNNYIPLNPEAVLGYYVSTKTHGGKKIPVMQDCMNVELLCDEMWVFENEDEYIPEGVLAEILLWENVKNSKIRMIPFFEETRAKYETYKKNLCEMNTYLLSEKKQKEIIDKKNKLDVEEITNKLLHTRAKNLENAYVIANFKNYKHIDWGREYCYQNNYCPISPQNILPYFTYRNLFFDYQNQYLNDRLTILDKVDTVVWFTNTRNIEWELKNIDVFSATELYYAKSLGKKIEMVDWSEAGVPKYQRNNNWAITTTERKEVEG